MTPSITISKTLSDSSILQNIANIVKQKRLEQNKSQSDLAQDAGVSRITISNFESGTKDINLLTLIQILRALDMLYPLESFKYSAQLSPIQLLRATPHKRIRASRKNKIIPSQKSNW